MSSGSVMGRCKMTVPAAEKITTRMIRITPVLTELSVSQIFRYVQRSDKAITFDVLAEKNARSAPTSDVPQNWSAIKQLKDSSVGLSWRCAWAITLNFSRGCRDFTQAETV